MTNIKPVNENLLQVSKELNSQVMSALSDKLQGFEKAFSMANAISALKQLLTPEVMAPIMELQGSKLGFLTDKDKVKNQNTGKYEKGPGYPVEIVKDCLIESMLLGLEPIANQWNIIGANMYPTGEGFGTLLNKTQGLSYSVTYPSVTQSADKRTANIKAIIEWDFNGEKNKQELDFPAKSDAYTTTDALIGKGERKARRWLYNKLKGTDIRDGDIQDIPHEVIKEPLPSHNQVSDDKERERIIEHITKSKTVEDLQKCEKAIKDEDFDLIIMYDDKKRELTPKK